MFDFFKKNTQFEKDMYLLVVSDLHYYNKYHATVLNDLLNNKKIDLILLLGDIVKEYIEIIDKHDSITKFGILGNHDNKNLYKNKSIINIHNNYINYKGISFAGFEGIPKYQFMDSPENTPSFTQKEASKILDNMNNANILISHTGPLGLYDQDLAHCGFKGINKYLKSKNTKLNIHGHFHKNTFCKCNSIVIGVYGISIINIKDYSVKSFLDL